MQVNLEERWPEILCCTCGIDMAPMMTLVGAARIGQMVLRCETCKGIAVVTMDTIMDMASGGHTPTHRFNEFKEAIDPPMAQEPLDVSEMELDQAIAFMELKEMWESLVRAGVDPYRLMASMPNA